MAKVIGDVITIRRQVGEALVLAPLPLAVADIEVDLHRAGYPLVAVGRDLDNECVLRRKCKPTETGLRFSTKPTGVRILQAN